MKMLHTLLVVLAGLGSAGAWAQWQWLDNDGKRVFSDRAPGPEIPAKNILKQPGLRSGSVVPDNTGGLVSDAKAPGVAVAAPAAAPKLGVSAPQLSKADKELETRKKQADEAEAAKRKAEEDRITKAKVENCARAKQAKATFDSGIRMARTNAKGETEVMDDATRAQELKRLQEVLASDCK